MSENKLYIDKLLKLKNELSEYINNNHKMFVCNINGRIYFTEKYIPLRLAYNKLKSIDDNIYNFIISYVYHLIKFDNNIKPSYIDILLSMTEKYYI